MLFAECYFLFMCSCYKYKSILKSDDNNIQLRGTLLMPQGTLAVNKSENVISLKHHDTGPGA